MIYDMYSRCLKIYISDADIANKILISLQYSNNTYDCIPLYSILRTVSFKIYLVWIS